MLRYLTAAQCWTEVRTSYRYISFLRGGVVRMSHSNRGRRLDSNQRLLSVLFTVPGHQIPPLWTSSRPLYVQVRHETAFWLFFRRRFMMFAFKVRVRIVSGLSHFVAIRCVFPVQVVGKGPSDVSSCTCSQDLGPELSAAEQVGSAQTS